MEVKSGTKNKHVLNQFQAQKKYAEVKNKKHIVFAPKMPVVAEIAHLKNGIVIVKDIASLVFYVKENEK